MPIATQQPRTKVGQDYASIGKLLWFYDVADVALDNANGGTVASARDLSGNGLAISQATANLRPTLITNADGFGNPCMRGTGTHYLRLGTIQAIPHPYTVFAVALSTGGSNNAVCGSGQFEVYWKGVDTSFYMYGGTNEVSIGTASLNVVHILTATFNGASSVGSIDGTASSTVNPGSTAVTTFNMMAASGGAEGLRGDFYLCGAYAGVLSSAQYTALVRQLAERFRITVAV